MALQDLLGPITTRTLVVENFDTFILSNIPYGVVLPRNVQWGAVEYDGPRAPGMIGTKAALQWHFGGVPYPITKAVRILYTYQRTWDGSDAIVTDTILIGFQDKLDEHIVAQPIPFIQRYSHTYFTRVNNLGLFGDSTNQAWGSQASVLASEAGGVVRAAPQTYNPHAAQRGEQHGPDFHTLLRNEFEREDQGPVFDDLVGQPEPIDFDGPAQYSDSHNIFPYTLAQLFNDPDMYTRVQFWYFAGIPRRVVKAIRIPLAVPAETVSLGQAEAAAAYAVGDVTKPLVDWKLPGAGGAKPALRRAHAHRGAVSHNAAALEEAQSQAQDGFALFIGYTGGNPGGGG